MFIEKVPGVLSWSAWMLFQYNTDAADTLLPRSATEGERITPGKSYYCICNIAENQHLECATSRGAKQMESIHRSVSSGRQYTHIALPKLNFRINCRQRKLPLGPMEFWRQCSLLSTLMARFGHWDPGSVRSYSPTVLKSVLKGRI